jgi:hypothetical protein
MEPSTRLYNCARCHNQVIICSPCDRNNIYCGSTCSRAARVQSCRLANHRYQRTLCGRLKHADRQKRYRERLKNKVTHHSSPVLPPRVVLPGQLNERISEALSGHYHCHFCGKPCSPLFRRDYLRHSWSRSLFWPRNGKQQE